MFFRWTRSMNRGRMFFLWCQNRSRCLRKGRSGVGSLTEQERAVGAPHWRVARVACLFGMAEQAAEKVLEQQESGPQALKRRRIFNRLAARVNSRPSRF